MDAPVQDGRVECLVFLARFEVVRVVWVGEKVLGGREGGAVDGVGMGFVAVGEDLVGSERGGGGGGCGGCGWFGGF